MRHTTILKTDAAILDYLQNLSDSELVNIHNQYCQNCNYSDDEIYNNDEDFFNTFFDGKVLDAVRAVSFGEYNYSHDYVMFNGYGNLESFDSPTDKIDLNAIASDILESPENYDIELEECFEVDGTIYEGEEDEAKDEYSDYVQETEEENEEAEEADKKPVLNFAAWCSENKTEVSI